MRNELKNYKDLLGGIKARVRQGQILGEFEIRENGIT
jgi:hypothetical protein